MTYDYPFAMDAKLIDPGQLHKEMKEVLGEDFAGVSTNKDGLVVHLHLKADDQLQELVSGLVAGHTPDELPEVKENRLKIEREGVLLRLKSFRADEVKGLSEIAQAVQDLRDLWLG
jgi:hypothetical protein